MVLCARDSNELDEAYKDLQRRTATVNVYVTDLTQPVQIQSLFQRIRREIGCVDVLINNAGSIQVGPHETMTMDDYHQAMLLHFWAPLLCTWQVLPDMRRRRQGRIVNISSIGGRIAVPHLAPYCASKFALNGLSQTLQAELARDGVRVTTVCPGLMRTGSPRHAMFKGEHRAEYAWFSIGDSLPLLSMGAERAARQIVNTCRHGRPVVTLSLPAKIAVLANAVAPNLAAEVSSVVARCLPSADGAGRSAVPGRESESIWAPSFLTTLSDRAAAQNNELA